tara:strand:+ start:6604 stop:7086 length:483 start_codon:yes stop_codon:yes gene_type:complete
MTDDLFHQISKAEVFTYHLVDGSYIVAEEYDYDEKNNVIFTTTPAKLFARKDGYALADWTIIDSDEVTELMADKIITRSEAPFQLKTHYNKFLLATKLRDHLESDELEKVLDESFNPFDVFDSNDSDEEKEEFNVENTETHKRRFEWKSEYDTPDDLSNN